jgi:ubiquinone/menaquinone biosynthesis C-methylase UbiE/DNA-binding transcriptional ArsR family regulator
MVDLMKMDATSGLLALRATAEQTRLRILFLLRSSELTVKDLTKVLGQSQPRISRHLKLLNEAGLIERHREGSWVYFRLGESGVGAALTEQILSAFDDSDVLFRLDQERLAGLVRERNAAAQAFFERNAGDWDRLRSLHVDEGDVEAMLLEAFGEERVALLVDLGTGTGRMLELLAGRFSRGLGIDANQSMLAYARSRLDGVNGSAVQVRQGDLYHLTLDDDVADAVVMHLVLHHLQDPAAGLREACRILAPGGRLFVVDFAPHDLDILRDEFAHERLGFGDEQMKQWLSDAGLSVAASRQVHQADASSQKLGVSLWMGVKDEADRRETSPENSKQVLETL